MMVVQHNMLAMNANRQLNLTGTRNAKSTEKLSSGYRINRAADDAAGLSISEKMRWQVRGLDRAAQNIQDGVSLVQIADGALHEATGILQRMRELSVQAANDTNTAMDREAAQKEIDESMKEFDRIARSTSMNGIYPLYANDEFAVDPTIEENTTPTKVTDGIYQMDAPGLSIHDNGTPRNVNGFQFDLGGCTPDQLNNKTFFVTCSASCNQTFAFSFDSSLPISQSSGSISGNSLSVRIGLGGNPSMSAVAAQIGKCIKDSDLYDGINDNASNTFRIGHANEMNIDGSTLTFFPTSGVANTGQSSYSAVIEGTRYENLQLGSVYMNGLENIVTINKSAKYYGLNIQSGALAEQAIQIPLVRMSGENLGIDPLDVSSFEAAGNSIDRLDHALEWINDKRANFGAVQNRLESAYDVNLNTSENSQAAESRIRDTDMAKEMMNYSMTNILNQAGQSMLSQSNQSMQSVMALLQ